MKKKLILSVLVSISPVLYGAEAPKDKAASSGEEVAAALTVPRELTIEQMIFNKLFQERLVSMLKEARAELRRQKKFISEICKDVVTPESVAKGRVALSVAIESVITDPEVGACLAALKEEAMEVPRDTFGQMLLWACIGGNVIEKEFMPQTSTSVAHELAKASGITMPSDEQITAIVHFVAAECVKLGAMGNELNNLLKIESVPMATSIGLNMFAQYAGPEAAEQVQAAIERKEQEVYASYATRGTQASPLSDGERGATMLVQKTRASLTPEERAAKDAAAKARVDEAVKRALERQKEKKDKEEQGK